MSVTPDFIGQVYRDTNTGNLWRANSLTPGDWTLEVQNMQVKWSPTTVHFEELTGFQASPQSLTGIVSVEFSQSAVAGIYYGGLNNPTDTIQSVSFPNLLDVVESFAVFGYDSLVSVSAPLLAQIHGSNAVDFDSCPSLTAINLDSLSLANGIFDIDTCTSIVTLSLPSLVTIRLDGLFNDCTLLHNVSMPLWLPSNGKTYDFSNCDLSLASVDHILSRGVANAAFVSGTMTLSGGTNSPPTSTAPGSDYAILTGRGVVVSVN